MSISCPKKTTRFHKVKQIAMCQAGLGCILVSAKCTTQVLICINFAKSHCHGANFIRFGHHATPREELSQICKHNLPKWLAHLMGRTSMRLVNLRKFQAGRILRAFIKRDRLFVCPPRKCAHLLPGRNRRDPGSNEVPRVIIVDGEVSAYGHGRRLGVTVSWQNSRKP